MLTKINDDGVECEKVDIIRIKTVPKFLSVMSVMCRKLCTKDSTDGDPVWDVDWGGSKEACSRWACTKTQPDKYD